MKEEFVRFELPDSIRILTGILQLLGAAGSIIGLFIPLLGIMASTGLALMMVIAFGVRIKMRDSLGESIPSLVFILINGYVVFSFTQLL